MLQPVHQTVDRTVIASGMIAFALATALVSSESYGMIQAYGYTMGTYTTIACLVLFFALIIAPFVYVTALGAKAIKNGALSTIDE